MAAIIVFGSGPASRRTPIFKAPPIFRVLENEKHKIQKERDSTPPRNATKKTQAESVVASVDDTLTMPRPTRVTFVEQTEEVDIERDLSNASSLDEPVSARPTKSSQIRTVFRHSMVELNEYSQERERRRRERQSTAYSISQSVEGRRSRMAYPDDPKMEAELYSFMVGSRYTDAHVYDKVALEQNVVLYKHDYKRRYNEHKLLRDSSSTELVQTLRAQTARQRREVVRSARSPLPHDQLSPTLKLYSTPNVDDADDDEADLFASRAARSRPSNPKWVPPMVESLRAAAAAKPKPKKTSVLPSVRGMSVKDALSVNSVQRQISQRFLMQLSLKEQQQRLKAAQQAVALKHAQELEEQFLKRVNEHNTLTASPLADNSKLTTTPTIEHVSPTDLSGKLSEEPSDEHEHEHEDEPAAVEQTEVDHETLLSPDKEPSTLELASSPEDFERKTVTTLTIEIPGLEGKH